MSEHPITLYTDDAVETAILGVLRSAQDHAILVSPYNQFWSHLRDEIQLALNRGVKLAVVYRQGQEGPDIDWLGANGATVYAVDRLHAKLFINESSVIMTSMNLLETSSKNSKEVALEVSDLETASKLRAYVTQRLIPLGQQVHPSAPKSRAASAIQTIARAFAAATEETHKAPTPFKSPRGPRRIHESRRTYGLGFCIRCASRINFDPARPLCDKDFAIWNRYADPAFTEKHCHRCGKPNETSYEKPLCYVCYKAVVKG